MAVLNKENLNLELDNAFSKLINWINARSEEDFNKEIVSGKWTIAQHLYHLIKSTKAVNNGMKMPKLALRTMFGKNNRAEKSITALEEKYDTVLAESNLKAPSEYSAEDGRIFEKAALLQRFKEELLNMKTILEKWDEKSLTKYVMPHPALGKITVREMVYSTIFHTNHHLRILEEQY